DFTENTPDISSITADYSGFTIIALIFHFKKHDNYTATPGDVVQTEEYQSQKMQGAPTRLSLHYAYPYASPH
ncbi:unnamed protein product, partial [Adineta ricciae]